MKLTVTSSPHIHSGNRTDRIMKDVLFALLPAVVMGVVFMGTRTLAVEAVCIASALLGEGLWRKITKKHQTLADTSAVVTGLLLSLTLPASVPYWVAALGALFAVIVVKGICGGLGQNVFNPALGARALLLLLFPVTITRFPTAGTKMGIAAVDAVTAATPLHDMIMQGYPDAALKDLFIGNIGGCIGEVSSIALLLGGAYLVIRKVISLRIPLAYLGSLAILSLLFSKGDSAVLWMAYNLLGGGAMLGAFFMATDYATSPVTPKGQIVFGIGAGALTWFFRNNGIFPEGVTYAILLMNAAVWIIDKYTAPRRFGTQKGGAR